MQPYKRPEAIKRMNELASSRKSFLFIIDYKQQCSFIEEVSRIDSAHCRYYFNGVTNIDAATGGYSGKVDWTFELEKTVKTVKTSFEISVLIDNGIIKEKDIRQEELSSYSFVRLFNAMIEWGALEFSTGTIEE